MAFAALLFARRLEDPASVACGLVAFGALCLAAGACYLVNDVVDIERDRRHPEKSQRPVASGRLSASAAITGAVVLVMAALLAAAAVNRDLAACVAGYVLLQLAYTFRLKQWVILDVLAIALGFVLRAVAGAVAIEVAISPWLLVCTLLLSLFLALAKRRGELEMLETEAAEHREALEHYSPYLLDQMIGVVTSTTLMAYCLYTFSERTIRELGTANLGFTIPFVIYGIFRYLYLVHQRKLGSDPSQLLLTDRPLLAAVVLWAAVAGVVVYLPWR